MKIAHIALLVSDLGRAAIFYESILGLRRVARPQMAFAGIWYELEGGEQIHLMQLHNPYADCEQPGHGGRDHHIALQVDHFDTIKKRLKSAGIAATFSNSGRMALFCRDPDGNTIELVGNAS